MTRDLIVVGLLDALALFVLVRAVLDWRERKRRRRR